MQLDFIMNSLDLIETLTSQCSMKTFAQVRIDFRSFPSDSCTNFLLLVQSIFHVKSECISFFSFFHKYRRSTIDSLLRPYDYGSVMHYKSKAFSKNGKPTMIVKKHGYVLLLSSRFHCWNIFIISFFFMQRITFF